MKHPAYIVKFNEDNIPSGVISAIIYKNINTRYYNAKYIVFANGDVVDVKSKDLFHGRMITSMRLGARIEVMSTKTFRFNHIIGNNGYPITECLFYNEKEFIDEFFAELF